MRQNHSLDPIAVIVLDVMTAIKGWQRGCVAQNTGYVPGVADAGYLNSMLDSYAWLLRRVALKKGSLKARCRFAEALLLNSLEARVCSVIRVVKQMPKQPSATGLLEAAGKLSVWRPLSEPVRVRWLKKGKGGFRTISSFGPLRTAQCLIVRDMLAVLGIDSSLDFSRKGGGGERALIQKVCDMIADGYNWWWTPDIKTCFASIKPGHFGWLPIDRRLLQNSMFLPKCARIEVVIPQDLNALSEALDIAPHPQVSPYDALVEFTIQTVRRGLPQGSVLSPLLARAVVGRILHQGLSETAGEGLTYCDDLTVGARTEKELGAARRAVTKAFSLPPAGPLELHDGPLVSARTGRLTVHGYQLQPGRGYGDNPVHVKPGRLRTNRFKERLAQKLLTADSKDDPFEVAEKYRRNWFSSQLAWTKVPYYSEDLCRSITLCYVVDFEHGEPMGGPVSD